MRQRVITFMDMKLLVVLLTLLSCPRLVENKPAFQIISPSNYSELDWNIATPWTEALRNLSQFSLDERCKLGMPLTAAIFSYPPYTEALAHGKPLNGLQKYGISGMMPELMNRLLASCCHRNAHVELGLVLPSLRSAEGILRQNPFDFVFPLYGYDVIQVYFRGHVYTRLFQAPSIVLLVQDVNSEVGRTNSLIKTLANAWPVLIFILVIASLASMVLWFLEHTSNSNEFPPSFFEGTWEGFWWALVTMTTVGYGDRTPKSRFGRVFAMLWILTGVTTVSIFTALVTSSLWASTSSNFRLHGSVIGALNGSEEYRLAVNLNAEVKAFSSVKPMLDELSNSKIDGAMIDNFVITEYLDILERGHLRTENAMYHPVTYGLATSPSNPDLLDCLHWNLYNYPDTRNQITAANLRPLKNPVDQVSAQFRAAEGLFFREKVFELITYCGMAIVGVLVMSGVIWEFCCRRPQLAKQLETHMKDTRVQYSKDDDDVSLLDSGIQRRQELRRMVAKYRAYHDEWIKAVQEACDERATRNQSAAGTGSI